MADRNRRIPTVEPIIMRPMFAAHVPATSVTWVSQASIDSGIVKSYNLRKRVEAVRNCRAIGKKDMKYNDSMPKMKVDPERYVSHDLGAYFLTFLYFYFLFFRVFVLLCVRVLRHAVVGGTICVVRFG
ncbi:hypothetical protein BDY21DRAFT_215182 [Lineolata rhizophorae]|uniref:Urease domain-containing protein n=1 Tax=Lineolata rhizophorae TaxID=578093 RepID=A0A6A6P2E3_9PEZI|nr:hypothetical protein BDY21DRAFT_215182 [Lineolata rhizophorae]